MAARRRAGLAVGQAAGAVYLDGGLRRVGHDDQGAGTENRTAVTPGVPDEGAGQALTAGRRIGLDVLVAGVPVADGEQPELRDQAAAVEGAEPGAGSCPGQSPPRRGPPFQVVAGISGAEAADRQVNRLLPVGVGAQRPDLGFGIEVRRRPDGGGGQYRCPLRLEPGGQEFLGHLDLVLVHADGDVPGRRELRGEPGQPGAARPGFGCLGEQDEVAPPVVRIVRAADEEVIAAIGDLGAFEDAQRQVGPEAERNNPHRTDPRWPGPGPSAGR